MVSAGPHGGASGYQEFGVRDTLGIDPLRMASDVGDPVVDVAEVRGTQSIVLRSPKLPSGKATLTLQNRGGLGQAPVVLQPVALMSLDIGSITTIAGGSTFVGDGGRAIEANLALPQGVAVDSAGNVYIVDTNHDPL